MLGKASIENYAEYEQLVGGVETLFGSGGKSLEEYAASVGKTVDEARAEFNKLMAAEQAVMDNADNAYKTAGMSANEYMNTVTSFSASLLQGLGGDTNAAAEIADRAIRDMSDNANKMGTDISMIQNAYQGFAKQNYTMLDNLKLGYGGTQEEMARLINESGVLGDSIEVTAKTVNDVSFDKIIEAIGVVQDRMGITGTTAAEASSTIQGSISTMKAAWQNLLTGMADPSQDMGALLGNLVDSVVTVGDNLIPRIQELLPRITEGITSMVGSVIEFLPGTLETILPTLVDGAGSLLSNFVQVLPEVFSAAMDALPQLVDAAVKVAGNLVTALIDSAPILLEAGWSLLESVTEGILEGIPDMIAKLPEVIDGFLGFITDSLPDVLDQGVELLNSLVDGIMDAIPDMVRELPKIIRSFVEFIAENFPKIVEAGAEILGNLVIGILGAIPELLSAVPELISALVDGFKNMKGTIAGIGTDIVTGVWNGIKSMVGWFTNQVTGFFSGIVDGVKNVLGIHSPSRVFADIGENMALGLGKGWDNEFKGIKSGIENGMDFGVVKASVTASGASTASNAAASALAADKPITIVVQSVWDKKVIAEDVIRYGKDKNRAYGG